MTNEKDRWEKIERVIENTEPRSPEEGRFYVDTTDRKNMILRGRLNGEWVEIARGLETNDEWLSAAEEWRRANGF